MVEVEDCLNAINKLQLNFHSSIVDKMEQGDIYKLAKEWQEQFKYWALLDFKEVVDHIIKNNKYFPKPSEFWMLKKEIIKEIKKSIIIFNCGYCKDTGVQAYKDKSGEIHICRCDCRIGQNHYKYLPCMSEIKKQGLSEYRIHNNQEPFVFIPQGEAFRLSREIAGENKFLLQILDKAEKNKSQNIARVIREEQREIYDEELPF